MHPSQARVAAPYPLCMDLDFTEDEIRRYSRHILLQDVGGIGQAKLKAARVLVIGAGGLGSPLMLYLAAAGVGTIGIVDHDRLELSNLQRQIAHTTDRIGQPKAASAAATAHAINPGGADRAARRAARCGQRGGADRRATTSSATAPTISPRASWWPMPACWRGAPWCRPRCCASRVSFRCSSRMHEAARATAACIPRRRPRAPCRHAARPACWAPSPA